MFYVRRMYIGCCIPYIPVIIIDLSTQVSYTEAVRATLVSLDD